MAIVGWATHDLSKTLLLGFPLGWLLAFGGHTKSIIIGGAVKPLSIRDIVGAKRMLYSQVQAVLLSILAFGLLAHKFNEDAATVGALVGISIHAVMTISSTILSWRSHVPEPSEQELEELLSAQAKKRQAALAERHFRKAKKALRRERMEKAIEWGERAYTIDNSFESLLKLNLLRIRVGQAQRAVENLSQALTIPDITQHPGKEHAIVVHFLLARAYLASGNMAQAKYHFEQFGEMLKSEMEDSQDLLQGFIVPFLDFLFSPQMAQAEFDFRARLQNFIRNLDKSDPTLIQSSLQEMLDTMPCIPGISTGLRKFTEALLVLTSGKGEDMPKAIDLLNESISHSEQSPLTENEEWSARLFRGFLQLRIGDAEHALGDVRYIVETPIPELLKTPPPLPILQDSWVRAGWILDGMLQIAIHLSHYNRHQEALDVLTRAASEFPEADLVRAWEGAILTRIGCLTEALKAYKVADSLKPDHPPYLDAVSVIYEWLGDLDQAEKWLEKAVSLSPRNTDYLSRLDRLRARRREAQLVSSETSKVEAVPSPTAIKIEGRWRLKWTLVSLSMSWEAILLLKQVKRRFRGVIIYQGQEIIRLQGKIAGQRAEYTHWSSQMESYDSAPLVDRGRGYFDVSKEGTEIVGEWRSDTGMVVTCSARRISDLHDH